MKRRDMIKSGLLGLVGCLLPKRQVTSMEVTASPEASATRSTTPPPREINTQDYTGWRRTEIIRADGTHSISYDEVPELEPSMNEVFGDLDEMIERNRARWTSRIVGRQS